MVIPIDAVRYGVGFDANGKWHETGEYPPTQAVAVEQEVLSCARGAIYGILASTLIWIGVLAGFRALLTLIR